jgi:molybdate transport system substrate-binding protein
MTELRLLGGGALLGLVDRVSPRFEIATKAWINATFGAVGAMRRLLEGRTDVDRLIVTSAMISSLVADGSLAPAPMVNLGTVWTAFAAPTGVPVREVVTSSELMETFAAASALYFPDPELAIAGIHVDDLIAKLGLSELVSDRLRPYANGAAAMQPLAEAGDPDARGCTQLSEIIRVQGVQLGSKLPADCALGTVYTAAIARTAGNPDLARALISLLADISSARDRAESGFE